MTSSSNPAPLRLGPYELIQRLATGGMAEVYLARREGPHGFQKIVAVKRILPQFARDPDFVAMFVDEARVCARLGHPNIVQVFDFGEQDGELYMAMEYVDGTTGARLVRAAAASGEEIPLDVCLHVTLSILRALEYAHGARDEEGKPLRLVHRDVSPGNVLIDRSGAVKLTDFGIARAAEIERRTDAGQLKGKLGYMSPEQVVGRELDARSDIFTLGIVLAEMLILRPLFSGGKELDVLLRIRDADLAAIDRAGNRVPDDVRAVLFRALARDPMLRWSTAASFAEGLEDVVRRRRLQVGPSRLAGFIERLGLIVRPDIEEITGEMGQAAAADRDSNRGLGSPQGASTSTDVTPVDTPLGAPGAPRAVATHAVSPNVYRVQREDGVVLGPMAFPGLVELFATGAVGAKCLIARERGRFKPATDYVELSRFLSSPALMWDQELPADAVDRGPLDPARLPTRLFQIAVRRETGALVLRNGPRQKRIFFVEGAPQYVTSTDKKELLGEFLIDRGQVLRMEVEMALAMLPRFGGRVGDALVGIGVLRPIELFRAIHDQTQERLLETFRWKAGELAFARGIRAQEETFPLGVDTYELIGRGIRQGYKFEELEQMLSPVHEEVIEPVAVPLVRLERFCLAERESAAVEAITGKTTLSKLIAELAAEGSADPEEVLRGVFLGLACELLRSPKWLIPPSFMKSR
ncbi:MAG: serine/threonine protein kinase [Myxococcota bacterium]|nr:serine/threonine protein kinase [Myxococcota bacterium]